MFISSANGREEEITYARGMEYFEGSAYIFTDLGGGMILPMFSTSGGPRFIAKSDETHRCLHMYQACQLITQSLINNSDYVCSKRS